jgi:hypothetical protein
MTNPQTSAVQIIRDWTDRLFEFAADSDGRRRQHLTYRPCGLFSLTEFPKYWLHERVALIEIAFQLNLKLENRVKPTAQAFHGLPALLEEAREALEALHNSISNPDSEGVSDQEAFGARQKYGLDREDTLGLAKVLSEAAHSDASEKCPRCGELFTNASTLILHFTNAHPRPEKDAVPLLDPRAHTKRADECATRLAEACRQIYAYLGQTEQGSCELDADRETENTGSRARAAAATLPAPSDESRPPGRPTARDVVLRQYDSRRKDRRRKGLPELSDRKESKELEEWAREPGSIPPDKTPPKADTIRRYLRGSRKPQTG